AMASSKRNGIYCALMFLDLDNFKPLNDFHGHDVGDMLLVEVARRLTACVREIDTVARFGGDEYIVMLSELNSDKAESTTQARIIAEKIRTSLAQPYLLKVNQQNKTKSTVQHQCSASIGLVLFINHDKNPEEIVRCADMAMYQAKKSGGNSIFIHEA
ncbi:MAG: GGDEF domain-containing protein, partial [Gallionellaceae bacterium]